MFYVSALVCPGVQKVGLGLSQRIILLQYTKSGLQKKPLVKTQKQKRGDSNLLKYLN
jgi:hypothetical protein